MLPIVIKNQHLGPAEFQEFWLELCEDHKAHGRAMAFAFLVYDFTNVEIREILASSNYWTALDEVSGRCLTILYLHAKNSRFETLKDGGVFDPRSNSEDDGANHVSYMNAVSHEEGTPNQVAKYLRSTFGLDEYTHLPFVVFFRTDGDKIADQLVVQLKEEGLDEAFRELFESISAATKALQGIVNRESEERMFNILKDAVTSARMLRVIRKRIVPQITLERLGKLVAYIGLG